MSRSLLRTGSLFLLAIVFTVGLTFATVELPHFVDDVLQHNVTTPGWDSHADAAARLKTELFMAHYHVRAIGYVAFFLLVGLIVLGFSTRRTGLAALGAFGVMLPVFAQFAGVMFFLAGLGVLNAVWLPILDVSYELQHWGRVIDAPNDLLRWLLGLVGIHSLWPTTLLFIGGGILVFLLGVYAWLTARAEGKGVADSWVYRVSRHPQYLGWILWTYGAYLLLQRVHYPRRSWGIGASLPWLISTMVIIGVALVEELNMKRRYGEAYETYRRSAPFLFPVPRFVERLFAAPFRLLFAKPQPDRKREVLAVVTLYTVLLMGCSAFFYAGGLRGTLDRLASSETRAARMEDLVTQIAEAATPPHGATRGVRRACGGPDPRPPRAARSRSQGSRRRGAPGTAIGPGGPGAVGGPVRAGREPPLPGDRGARRHRIRGRAPRVAALAGGPRNPRPRTGHAAPRGAGSRGRRGARAGVPRRQPGLGPDLWRDGAGGVGGRARSTSRGGAAGG
jgi:protein-S-isoprenylcysteine O-methyltransferase Ste14